MKKLLTLLLASVFLSACTDDTLRIDGTSDEAFDQSVEVISESIAGTELHSATTQAMAKIMKSGGFITPDSKIDKTALRKALDGMSAEDIVTYAESLE
ncbi:MAG: hypothetical protein AAF357_03030 [Verrucomicrobiota bacterium]